MSSTSFRRYSPNNTLRIASSIQKLYGREEELRALRRCLEAAAVHQSQRSTTTDSSSPSNNRGTVPLIFVSGLSGTGKTALIEHAFCKDQGSSSTTSLKGRRTTILGCGKYELSKDPTPYGILGRALRQISRALTLSGDQERYAELLSKRLSPEELKRLEDLIPELQELMVGVGERSAISSLLLGSAEEPTNHRIEESSSTATACNGNNNHNETSSGLSSAKHSQEDLEKLKSTIRIFLRTISIAERPVVLWLDDIQWMDALTLDVLQPTLLDRDLQHFVFVASFRTNEVNKGVVVDNVQQFIETIKSSWRATEYRELHVENLSTEAIHQLLRDTLRTDDGIAELADLLVERTGGNIFHTIQMLGHLEERGLLEYSILSFCWTWDLDRVRDETMVTQNVAEILRAKIDLLSPSQVQILKICACLGYRFQESLLSVVIAAAATAITQHADGAVERIGDCTDQGLVAKINNRDGVDPMKYCERLLQEGLLERVGDCQLNFTHDKVHHAALDLFFDDTERIQLHYHLGKELHRRYLEGSKSDKVQEDLLFLCVDRLNSGMKAMDKNDKVLHVQLCQLNLQAACRAADLAAFEHALVYSKNGLDLVKNIHDPWSEHYNLTLGLNKLYGRMCLRNGKDYDDDLVETVELIQKHSKRIEDSTDAWFTMLQFHAERNKRDEMVSTFHFILEKVGEKMQRSPTLNDARAEFIRIAAKLDILSDDDILELPRIDQHSLKNFCILVLDYAFHPLHHHGSAIQILCACRMVDLTLRFGLGDYAARAFGCFSKACVSDFFETSLSTRAANLALRIMGELSETSIQSEAAVRNLVVTLYTWHKPLSMIVEFQLGTYRIGMRSGEMHSASLAVVGYGYIYYYSGLALKPLVKDMTKFIHQIYDFGQKTSVLVTLSVIQCALNLTADVDSGEESENTVGPVVAPGAGETVFDIGGGASKAWRERLDWDGTTGSQSDLSYLMQIAIFCRNFPLASETKEKLVHSEKTNASSVVHGAYYFGLARAFYIGLVSYWQAKKCSKVNVMKRQRYLKEAKNYHSLLRGWVVDQGSINLPQKLFILDAEEASLAFKSSTGKRGESALVNLKAAYEKAIVTSMRSGFTQDAALAAHLASETFPAERAAYWQRARDFYLQWGAVAVVRYVEQHHMVHPTRESIQESIQCSTCSSEYCPSVEDSSAEDTGFRARSRFGEIPEEKRLLSTDPKDLRLRK